jgi:SAM-dependent methyltransferase
MQQNRFNQDHPIIQLSRCTVCNSTSVSTLIEITQLPVLCNALCSTAEEAIAMRRGDITLGVCHDCRHIFNLAFNPQLMLYDANYENSLHFSPQFQSYVTELANRLIQRYDLRNKTVIEIGCGKGDFLALMCELGNNRGIGFDSSFSPERAGDLNLKNITFIQDFYSSRYADYRGDCVCCRHVLEHIQDPQAFLTTIHDLVDPAALIFFEVPNALFTLSNLGLWDFIYEHCSYFTPDSLNFLFSQQGFEVRHSVETFGGQYLNIEAFKGDNRKTVNSTSQEAFEGLIEAFQDRYKQTVSFWREKLEKLRHAKKRVVLWGAGSKGAMFLNILHATDAIEFAVDINPYKQGRYIVGVGKQIVSPEFLRDYQPEGVIILNPMYVDEIHQQIRLLGLNAEAITF